VEAKTGLIRRCPINIYEDKTREKESRALRQQTASILWEIGKRKWKRVPPEFHSGGMAREKKAVKPQPTLQDRIRKRKAELWKQNGKNASYRNGDHCSEGKKGKSKDESITTSVKNQEKGKRCDKAVKNNNTH